MFSRTSFLGKTCSQVCSIQLQQTRNTFIVKRRFPLRLHKAGGKPPHFKQKQYVYDLVKNTNIEKKPDIQVILMEFIEGLGFKGDIVSVRPNYARCNLLLPKLAVYASPENIAKYVPVKEYDAETEDSKKTFSSVMTAKFLSRAIVVVSMNMDNPWTIEKWHVRIALRKGGMYVPEDAIEMPKNEISGPNPDLEGKMFLVTINVNGLETSVVRCRIHHWTPDVTKIKHLPLAYEGELAAPIFPEDEEIIKSLPAPSQVLKKPKITIRN